MFHQSVANERSCDDVPPLLLYEMVRVVPTVQSEHKKLDEHNGSILHRKRRRKNRINIFSYKREKKKRERERAREKEKEREKERKKEREREKERGRKHMNIHHTHGYVHSPDPLMDRGTGPFHLVDVRL